jgi:hypothetical protein
MTVTNAELNAMSVSELEALIIHLENDATASRLTQKAAHDVAEKKRASIPVAATPNDQVITPGKAESPLDFVLNLPAAVRDSIKAALNGEK